MILWGYTIDVAAKLPAILPCKYHLQGFSVYDYKRRGSKIFGVEINIKTKGRGVL